MNTTIAECLAIYTKELTDYLQWLEPLKHKTAEIYRIDVAEVNHFEHFEGQDYEKATILGKELEAMEKVLGMSQEEADKFLAETLEKIKK